MSELTTGILIGLALAGSVAVLLLAGAKLWEAIEIREFNKYLEREMEDARRR